MITLQLPTAAALFMNVKGAFDHVPNVQPVAPDDGTGG